MIANNNFRNFVLLSIMTFLIIISISNAQIASPANWLYPDGTPEATKQVKWASLSQSLDSIKVKWFSSAIAGDVKPLVGNLIANDKLFDSSPFAPNEIAAVVGNKIVIIDGTGRLFIQDDIPDFINSISALMDTTLADGDTIKLVTGPVVMGLETIETQRTNEKFNDTMAYAYISGFSNVTRKAEIIKRLSVNMIDMAPNFSASIKPVFAAQRNSPGGQYVNYYAIANTAKPDLVGFDPNISLPFLKGALEFEAFVGESDYPQFDVGESFDLETRFNGGMDFYFAQPSIRSYFLINKNVFKIALPTHIDINVNDRISNIGNFVDITFNKNSIRKIDISDEDMSDDFQSDTLSSRYVKGKNPFIRNYLIDLFNPNTNTIETFQLLSIQYSGLEGSEGTSSLFLTNETEFEPYYDPANGEEIGAQYLGKNNHFWALATGNVDGSTSRGIKYPNNPGSEIVVTNSSSEFVVADNKLSVLKFNGNNLIPSSPSSFLSTFDTVATHSINGYVAAVNDLDGDSDNKRDEILIVDGSRIRVLRMKDYNDVEFDLGSKFDTVYTHSFGNETITSAIIADMEGDGKNDIIVTTFNGTYVLGEPLDDILDVLIPSIDDTDKICIGDSILIRWRNIVQNYTNMDLFFREVINGTPVDTLIIVDSNIVNELDIIDYYYFVDKQLLGKTGYFIVQGQFKPEKMVDSTAMVTFADPTVLLESLKDTDIIAGSFFEIKGETACFDSLSLYISIDSQSFTRTLYDIQQLSNTFTIQADIPCPEMNSCDLSNTFQTMTYFLETYSAGFVLKSDTVTVEILPSPFNVEILPEETADPSKIFTWDVLGIDNICDTLSMYYSIDQGVSFVFIDRVPSADQMYSWNLPIGLPDEAIFRLCCENSCYRLDTLITGTMLSSIQMVSPNPVAPPLEQVEIIYTPTEDTEVDITIVDFSNRLVANPVKWEPKLRNIVYTSFWDGRTSSGDIVHNGLYYIRLEYKNGTVDIYPIYVKK